jgi:hypothetical protein
MVGTVPVHSAAACAPESIDRATAAAWAPWCVRVAPLTLTDSIYLIAGACDIIDWAVDKGVLRLPDLLVCTDKQITSAECRQPACRNCHALRLYGDLIAGTPTVHICRIRLAALPDLLHWSYEKGKGGTPTAAQQQVVHCVASLLGLPGIARGGNPHVYYFV